MDFSYSPTQQSIIDAIEAIMADFDDDYWLAADRDGRFPEEFYAAIAAGGWLGIAMPEAYGGAALGIAEAALMMQKIAETGGGMAAASAVHINIFGPHPIVVYGTEEQRSAWLPPLIKGEVKCCFGVTEPDAGLDTGNIRTRADKIDEWLSCIRAENLDINGAGGKQNSAFGANQPAKQIGAPNRWVDVVLHRS